MSFDGLLLFALYQEMAPRLLGSRVDKIYQPSPDEIYLNLRGRGENLRLVLSAHAENARIHLTSVQPENPAFPPTFCMLLRKHLEGNRILAFEQNGFDRVVSLTFEGYNEVGDLHTKKLILEIMGRHSNLILLDADSGVIYDGIHRVTQAISRYREVLPGRLYVPPPPQDKWNPREIDREGFYRHWLTFEPEKSLQDFLLSFSGLGPLTAREIAYRAGFSLKQTIGHLGEAAEEPVWREFHSLLNDLWHNRLTPAVITDGQGKMTAFSWFPATHIAGGQISVLPSLSAAADLFYGTRAKQSLFFSQQSNLLRIVQGEIGRLAKKIALLEETLAEAADREQYRLYGELLTANLYQVKKGDERIEVINYYHPQQELITIPLDPTLSPAQNAQVLFKKYNKAKSTLQAAGHQLAEARAEKSYLDSLAVSLAQAETMNELAEIRREMEEEGLVRPAAGRGKDKKQQPPRFMPLEFTSRDGFPLLVGRNNKQNDYLTLKVAKDNDLWLHVKDMPGSHVIIRSGGKPVPDETLLDAARLAAYYSKGRMSGQVPVDYTLKKHVRKPAGAKPGMVVYDHQKTLFVTPSAELVQKLKREK